MNFTTEITIEAKRLGAEYFFVANISTLPEGLIRNYPAAIVIGVPLSTDYLKKVIDTPDYIEEMKRNKLAHEDEFDQKEKLTDHIADELATFISSKGYSAFSQSEASLYRVGSYDEKNHRTPLPHKTIALLAGMGSIGKHDLLITPQLGSAIVICTVLTDAPLAKAPQPAMKPTCGSCTICKEVCPTQAITGKNWSIDTPREEIIDVHNCTMCLKCLALCPYTRAYISRNR
jgi:epoxyqueuosine reductase QueG